MSVNIGGAWKAITETHCNIGGVWKRVTEIWCNIGGTWKRAWSAIKMLYNYGVELVAWVVGASALTGSQSKEADHLYLTCREPAGEDFAYRTYVTNGLVGLTNYTTMHVEWEAPTGGGPNAHLVASTVKLGDPWTYDARVIKAGTGWAKRTDSVNISALSGDYYVRVHLVNSAAAWAYLKVYKVWLE